MHLSKLSPRLLLLFPAAALAIIVALAFGVFGSSRESASAAGTFDPNGVICINLDYLGANRVEQLVRFDHNKDAVNTWDVTLASYVGDTNMDGIPDTGNLFTPAATCTTKTGGPYLLNPAILTSPSNPAPGVYNRPITTATLTAGHFKWALCSAVSGPFGPFVYSSYDFTIPGGAKAFGTTGTPTAGANNTWIGQPTNCTPAPTGSPTFGPVVMRGVQRVTIPNKLSPTPVPSPVTAGTLDWDGDGCSDYDELSPDKTTRHGLNPFILGDCTNTTGIVAGTLDLDGIYDLVVTLPSSHPDQFKGETNTYTCMLKLDHNTGTNALAYSTSCYDNGGLLDAGGTLGTFPDVPGEGSSGDHGGLGPPPPPDYNTWPSFGNGAGVYCPGPGTCTGPDGPGQPADSLVLYGCQGPFAGNGTLGGPYVVVKISDGAPGDINFGSLGPAADLTSMGKLVGRLQFWFRKGTTECDAAATAGTPPKGAVFPLPQVVKFHPTTNRAECPTGLGGVTTNGPVCEHAGWRADPLGTGTATDWDGDGCSDSAELSKPPTGKCGKDPWNPYDPTGASPNVSGPYDFIGDFGVDIAGGNVLPLVGRAYPVDACWNNTWAHQGQTGAFDCTAISNGTAAPGTFVSCRADIQQVVKALTARAVCYLDSKRIVVNKPMAGDPLVPVCATTNPVAAGVDTKFCGDGLPGQPSPGCSLGATCQKLPNQPPPAGACTHPCTLIETQYQINNIEKAGTFSGVVDNTGNPNDRIKLAGCFENLLGHQALGYAFVQLDINAHTLAGTARFWAGTETMADCTGNVGNLTHIGNGLLYDNITIHGARQGPGIKTNGSRDSDQDGCPDKREMGDNANLGGLRDPYNPFDYPDMPIGTGGAKDHQIRIGDVSYVIQHYRHDQGGAIAPLYDPQADHGAGIPSGNSWNLRPGDGEIRIGDVSAVIQQYRKDCAP